MTTDTTLANLLLRDYFATHVDIGDQASKITSQEAAELGIPFPSGTHKEAWLKWRAAMQAKMRYMAADAMLVARGR